MLKKYHFIAIGGIGMSGLAKYLLEDGHSVSGSDIVDSKYIDAIKKMGGRTSILVMQKAIYQTIQTQ